MCNQLHPESRGKIFWAFSAFLCWKHILCHKWATEKNKQQRISGPFLMELWRGCRGLTLDSPPDLLSQSDSDASCAPDKFIHSSVCVGSLPPFFKAFICSSVWAATNGPTWLGRRNGLHAECALLQKDRNWHNTRGMAKGLGLRGGWKGGGRGGHDYASVLPDKRQPLPRTASLGFGGSLRSLFPAWEEVAQCACSGFDESPIPRSCC